MRAGKWKEGYRTREAEGIGTRTELHTQEGRKEGIGERKGGEVGKGRNVGRRRKEKEGRVRWKELEGEGM